MATKEPDGLGLPDTFTIRESGDSVVVTIDKEKLNESELGVGDEITFEVPDDDDRNLQLVNAADRIQLVR